MSSYTALITIEGFKYIFPTLVLIYLCSDIICVIAVEG